MASHPLLKEGPPLREYQEASLAVALEKDTLVVLPTGLGKTMIATHLAAYRLGSLKDSKALILAPTKPLCQQHEETFRKALNLGEKEFALITGSINAEKRKIAWKTARLVIATPQTIENDVISGNIHLKDVSLVVFDEAHRAVGDYSYTFLAKKYEEQARNKRTLALTASPGSDREKIDEVIKNLCVTEVEIRTEADRDVKGHVQRREVEWVKIPFPENFMRLRKLVEGAIGNYVKTLRTQGYLPGVGIKTLRKKDILSLQSELRQAMAKGEPVGEDISATAALLKLYHAEELLETQGLFPLKEYWGRLRKQKSRAVFGILSRKDIRNAIGLTELLCSQNVEHPKLEKLREICHGQIEASPNSKIIVFSQYRDSVDNILKSLESLDNVLAKKLIGQARTDKTAGMSQKAQKETLAEFNLGVFNTLVATSVGEEGLDVDEVDLVVFYEPVPSEIRTIQRRGRTARKKEGKQVVLVTQNTRDEAFYWSAFHKERRMKSAISDLKDELSGVKKEEGDPKQKNLSGFIPEEKSGKGLEVIVDQRERASGIARKLSELGASVKIEQLPVADFIVSERVAIERKEIDDFLESLIDGRLLRQAKDLSANFARPVIIIEGDASTLYSRRNIHPEAIRGALCALATGFEIPILHSKDEEDTARLILSLGRRERERGESKEFSLRGDKHAMSDSEHRRYIIESLPDVSSVLAKRLIDNFASVESVICASETELCLVDGIGKKTAKKIRDIVSSQEK